MRLPRAELEQMGRVLQGPGSSRVSSPGWGSRGTLQTFLGLPLSWLVVRRRRADLSHGRCQEAVP